MSVERDLLAALVIDDPVCYSTEGLDDGCHFCGAWPKYCRGDRDGCDNPTMEGVRLEAALNGRRNCGYGDHRFAEHEPDCAWLRAARFLERDIGHHREVKR